MLKPKHLYTITNFYWLVFPTLEDIQQCKRICGNKGGFRRMVVPWCDTDAAAKSHMWSTDLDCLVSWIGIGTNFMVVDIDKNFETLAKVLGDKAGWIATNPHDSVEPLVDCFEEITNA